MTCISWSFKRFARIFPLSKNCYFKGRHKVILILRQSMVRFCWSLWVLSDSRYSMILWHLMQQTTSWGHSWIIWLSGSKSNGFGPIRHSLKFLLHRCLLFIVLDRCSLKVDIKSSDTLNPFTPVKTGWFTCHNTIEFLHFRIHINWTWVD